MSLIELHSLQADEHSKLEKDIVQNVAERNWTKKELIYNMALLYAMGFKHGVQDAREATGRYYTD